MWKEIEKNNPIGFELFKLCCEEKYKIYYTTDGDNNPLKFCIRKGIDIYKLPFSMLYGILEDFFDSQGIYIEVTTTFNKDGERSRFNYSIVEENTVGVSEIECLFKTRKEARIKATQKAFEILEDKLKEND